MPMTVDIVSKLSLGYFIVHCVSRGERKQPSMTGE